MKISIFLILVLLSVGAGAQQLVWNSAQVYVKDTALLWVNGNVQSTHNNTILSNEGRIVTRVGSENGNFTISDSAHVLGNGSYELEGDWINSAIFQADSSLVLLEGLQDELITGDSISWFFDLETDGTNIKRQTLDAYTTHHLELNSVELAIDSFRMTVTNPEVLSVENNRLFLMEGFASTLLDGKLVRAMDRDTIYHFPMGSSAGVQRYRPVDVSPNAAAIAINTFEIGFNNYDASLDGYNIANHDSSICLVNPLFYHNLDHTNGSTPFDLRFYYHPNDGYFNRNVHWEEIQATQWDTIPLSGQTFPDYRTILSRSITNYNPQHFALAVATPGAPLILGDTIICDPDLLWTYEADPPNSNSTYVWNIPNDAQLAAGQGTELIDVDWLASSGGQITVQEVDTLGCASYTGTLDVNLFPGLEANFDTIANHLFGQYEFGNYSTGADYYYWNFGDGNSASDSMPIHQYDEPGTYEVILTIENQYGCQDYDTLILVVPEGVNIPNVFTPNGDHVNDLFFIDALGLQDSYFSVFNRWGKEVFTSSKIEFSWDGTNQWTGQPLSQGTYFYIFKGSTGSQEYDLSGHLMLQR